MYEVVDTALVGTALLVSAWVLLRRLRRARRTGPACGGAMESGAAHGCSGCANKR